MAYRQTFLSLIFLGSVVTVFYSQVGDPYNKNLTVEKHYLPERYLEVDKNLQLPLTVGSKASFLLFKSRLPRATFNNKEEAYSTIRPSSLQQKPTRGSIPEMPVKDHQIESLSTPLSVKRTTGSLLEKSSTLNTDKQVLWKSLPTKPGMAADYCNFPENMKPGDEGTVHLKYMFAVGRPEYVLYYRKV